jgi:RNA polymerase primary sigma factor
MTAEKTRTYKTGYSNDENILSIYLKEINNIPLLSRADEDKYARLAADGEKHAREVLIKSNLRFVVNVAKKYQNKGIPLSDLINEGNIGLMNAIEKYDVDRGYHFISYAVWWIKQSILKSIGEKSRMIRLPLNRAGELVQIERAKKELLTENGIDPELKEIAEAVGLDEEHVRDLINISRDLVSIDNPVKSGERESALLSEYIVDTKTPKPEEIVIDSSLRSEINKLLETLSEKEADIIEQRFGLNGLIPMSLKEIGDRYNLTKERIRQIEKKALDRLKHVSRSQYLEAFV